MNKQLLKDNYLVIREFISPEEAKRCAKEFREIDSKEYFPGDDQAPNSAAAYNIKPALEIHCNTTHKVSEAAQTFVLPTYCYSRIYKTGCDLKRHIDRAACEVSVTLHLEGDLDWPICIEASDGTSHSVVLNPCDAMIYLGCIAPHWRKRYRGKEYIQFFMHYVRSDGGCAEVYFDKEDKVNNLERIEILTKEYNGLR